MEIISKEQLVESVLKFYNENPNNFNHKNYRKYGFSDSVINKYYGKWSNLCEELNLPYAKRNRYTKEEVLQDIKEVISTTNSTNRENYLKHGKYSRAVFEKFFGSWNEILELLDYKINMYKNVTKEEVIQEMLRLQEKHNGYFTAVIQRKESKYSQPIIDRLFGSFSNMLRELNLRSPYGKAITDEEIINEIKDIYNRFGTISGDLIDEFSSLSTPTIIHRFGSMQEAYEKANVSPSDDNQSKLSKYVLSIANSILNETPKLEYTFPWLINPRTNKKLRVDAYYPKNNIIIEVDGRQHFDPNCFRTNEGFEVIKYRDNLKDTLIPKNNIKLLRIPYNYTLEEISNAIESSKG